MKSIIVTGSSGQLGSETVRLLRQKNYPVKGVDIIPSQTADLILDITNKDAVFTHIKQAGCIVHTAAVHGKQYALGYPRQAFIDTNITGTLNLLEACKQNNIPKLVYISTTSIYGNAMQNEQEAVWVDESLTPEPRDIYDITKQTAEHLCRDYSGKENVETLTLRVSRFLPEPENTEANHRLYRGLDVRDGAAAILLAIEKTFDSYDCFNISCLSPFKQDDVFELKHHPEKVVEKYFSWAHLAYKKRGWKLPDEIDRVYSIEKAMRVLGYKPEYNFEQIFKNN